MQARFCKESFCIEVPLNSFLRHSQSNALVTYANSMVITRCDEPRIKAKEMEERNINDSYLRAKV